VTGTKELHGIDYAVPMASAQVKSAILFAALGADRATTIVEHVRTRPTTEEMFSRAGVAVVSMDVEDGRSVTIQPGRPLARNWLVPGDPSQAAFFAVLGSVHPNAELEVLDIDSARLAAGRCIDVTFRRAASDWVGRDFRIAVTARGASPG